MKMSASITSSLNMLQTEVCTNGSTRRLSIAAKPSGFGSSVNGGELLLLALATCYCNDIFREAGKRSIAVSEVTVTVTAEFGAEGEPGHDFQYTADVKADAHPDTIRELILFTDQVAEIHNTLRKGVSVTLRS